MTRDWKLWHRYYDSPTATLTQRLGAVREQLRRALACTPGGNDGAVRLTVVCAGEGRDVLPVLAEHARRRDVHATLLEIEPDLARRARETSADLGLSGVDVRMDDAGRIDTYRDVPPAHVLLVCGVFGNISVQDVHRTIQQLPALLAPEGVVIWTRGINGYDRSTEIRDWFTGNGFIEISFERTAAGDFGIGMVQLAANSAGARTESSGDRMFTFR